MKIELSTEEEEHLHKLQRSLKDGLGYAKVTCILMVVKGSEPQFVAECLGMDPATVYRWIGAYRRGGIDGVLENRYKGWWGMLDSFQMAALSNELREGVYTTAKSVRAWISEEFGVEYTREGGGPAQSDGLYVQEDERGAVQGGRGATGGSAALCGKCGGACCSNNHESRTDRVC